jgi:Arc/MetJ family transcription regulator
MYQADLFLCYAFAMRRTSVEIDEERLARAQRTLGTTGIKDTIDRALDEVYRAELRRHLAERVRSGKGIDRGEELLEASRRWQR